MFAYDPDGSIQVKINLCSCDMCLQGVSVIMRRVKLFNKVTLTVMKEAVVAVMTNMKMVI